MKLIYNNKEVANNTKNYNELLNKPLLNSKELIGNVSLNDINVYNKKEVDNLIASTRSVKAVTALPSPLVENTMYYVGPDADNNYHVYLVDSALTLIDLGMAREESMYKAGAGIEIDTSNNIIADIDYETISLNSEGKIYVPTLEGTKGSNIRPVYLEDGQITPVKQVASGNYTEAVPFIGANGITETGWAFDFHNITSTADYDVRMGVNSANGKLEIAYPSTANNGGYLVTSGANASVGTQFQPVYINNGLTTQTPQAVIESNSDFSQARSFNTVDEATTYFKANSPGRIGHVRFTTASTIDGITIPDGWYSFIWSSYFGGPAGTIPDAQQYGTLQLSPTINNAANSTYIVTDNDGTLSCRQVIAIPPENSHMPEVFNLHNPANSSRTTLRGWHGKDRTMWYALKGLQVEGISDVRKVKITASINCGAIATLNWLKVNASADANTMTVLSGINQDGSVITPSRTSMPFDSTNGFATYTLPTSVSTKNMTYTIEWDRWILDNDTFWVGKFTLQAGVITSTSCYVLSGIVAVRLNDSNISPILYTNLGTDSGDAAHFVIELY